MATLPRGKGGPQVIVYEWKGTPGHVSIQIGDRYLSHVRGPGPETKIGPSRIDIKEFEGKSIPIMRHTPFKNRTLKQDKDTYGEDPIVRTITPDQFNLFPMMKFMDEMACGITGTANRLSLPKPLPHFDLSQATFTELREVEPRNKSQFLYYQMADSKDGHGNLKGDRSNCATAVADCIVKGISLDKQDVSAVVGAQVRPSGIGNALDTKFQVKIEEPPKSAAESSTSSTASAQVSASSSSASSAPASTFPAGGSSSGSSGGGSSGSSTA